MHSIHKYSRALWIIFTVLTGVSSFENSSAICTTTCSCTSQEDTFLMTCAGVQSSLANWPNLTRNETVIEAFFSNNKINRLESMPGTNASLIVHYDHCNITELVPGLFENAVNIKYVDLSYNLLIASQLHSEVFKGPYNNSVYEPIALEHLNLAYNDIRSLAKNVFEHMPELKWLSLEGNQFRVIDLITTSAMSSLTKLEYLNMANNQFLHMPEKLLQPMAVLNVLDLSSNQIDFVPLTVLEVSKTLKKLSIDDTTIVEFTDESFLGMTQLTELSAKNMKELRAIKTNAFAPLENLRKIDLSGLNGSRIEIDDEAFGNITELRELNLSHGGLRSIPMNLVNWTELRSLDLRKNEFVCECYLVNITHRLSEEIRAERDGPECFDTRRHRAYAIYSLAQDACYKNSKYSELGGKAQYHFRLLRVSLLVLSVMLLITAGVAVWLYYGKMLRARRDQQYPFASSVIYNPVATNTNF